MRGGGHAGRPLIAALHNVQFAAAKAGLVLVNINPAYQAAELEHVLLAAGCRALVTAGRFKSSDYVGMVRDLLGAPSERGGSLASARTATVQRVIVLDDAQAHPYLP
jgi:fatty-acyl-CoA synthase